jgi:MFS transporter, DHA1 family, multidrug resistance protein
MRRTAVASHEAKATTGSVERGSWVLAAAIALQWLGSTALIPILPFALEADGVSATTIGVVMGSYHLGSVAASYGGGRLADRIGARTIGVGSFASYVAASVGLAASDDSIVMTICRTVQGGGAGAGLVAALALVSHHVPLQDRGRNFGVVNGGRVAGIALGPVLGGMLGANGRVIVSGGAAVLGCVGLCAVLVSSFSTSAVASLPEAAERPPRAKRTVVGVLLLGACAGLPTGLFESVWTLFLQDLGATAFEVGLTYPLFAIPFVLVAVPAGRFADKHDRRLLALAPVATTLIVTALYPFVPTMAVIMAMVVLDAVLTSLALPAIQSLLTQASTGTAGRSLGAFALCLGAATAVSSTFGGALYDVADWLPFVSMSGAAMVVLAFVPVLIRGLPSRATGEAAQ